MQAFGERDTGHETETHRLSGVAERFCQGPFQAGSFVPGHHGMKSRSDSRAPMPRVRLSRDWVCDSTAWLGLTMLETFLSLAALDA